MIAQLIVDEVLININNGRHRVDVRVTGFGVRFYTTLDWFRLIIYKSVPVYLSTDGRGQ